MWREGLQGHRGLTPAFTPPAAPPAPSSLFHLALPFSGCLLTQFFLPNSAQNFRITRHLTSHLNPSSRCCPQTGSRAITWRLFEMQRPGLHPQTSQIRVCFKTGGSTSDLYAQWGLRSTSLHCQRLEATVYIIPEHARIPLTGNQVARPPFHPGTSKACVCVCV